MQAETSKQKLHIAINTLQIRPGMGGGETTLTNVIANLLKLAPQNRYLLYVDGGNRTLFARLGDRVELQYCPVRLDSSLLRALWEQIVLPSRVLRDHVDVLISPINIAPAWLPCASVVHVQSLQAVLMPQYVSLGKRLYQGLLLRRSVNRADAVMTPSAATKRDLIKLTGVPESKVLIAPEAATPPRDQGLDSDVGRGSFILAVSTLYPFKNYEGLINAFALFRKKCDLDYELRIAGGDYCGQQKRFLSLAKQLGIEKKITFLGRVERDKVWQLYRKSSLMVFISFYETFGLPILEAMACGCPVLASNGTSIPEVAGDAALVVDPNNEKAIAEGMYRLLTDRQLRERFISRGLERVKLFSWRKTASVYLEAIEAAVGEQK